MMRIQAIVAVAGGVAAVGVAGTLVLGPSNDPVNEPAAPVVDSVATEPEPAPAVAADPVPVFDPVLARPSRYHIPGGSPTTRPWVT